LSHKPQAQAQAASRANMQEMLEIQQTASVWLDEYAQNKYSLLNSQVGEL
jgi:hypothetical protein